MIFEKFSRLMAACHLVYLICKAAREYGAQIVADRQAVGSDRATSSQGGGGTSACQGVRRIRSCDQETLWCADETNKDIANQLVVAESASSALPIGAHISAHTLADELKEISMHLAGAARYGAATSHRLPDIAHHKAGEIDDAEPLDDKSRLALGDIAVLTKMANGAAEIGLNLLKASKEVKPDDDAPTPVGITFGVKDAKRHDDNPV